MTTPLGISASVRGIALRFTASKDTFRTHVVEFVLQARLQAAEVKRLRLLEDVRRRATGKRAMRVRDALRAGSDQTRDKRSSSKSLASLQLDDWASVDQKVRRWLASGVSMLALPRRAQPIHELSVQSFQNALHNLLRLTMQPLNLMDTS
jgi:hypothetical protein